MTLKSYYRDTYGSDAEKMACRHGKCLLELAKFKNHVIFSARCKRVGVLPHSLKIKPPIRSPRGCQIAQAAGQKFLNERLRLTNRRIEKLEEERKWTEIELRRTLSDGDYERLMETISAAAEKVFVRTREKQRKKFDRQFAEETKRGKESMDKSKWVVNLSERRLSEEETKVLELGMKFAPAPKKIPTMEIVAQVEDALSRSCEPAEADRARAAVANAIKYAKPPKSNIRKEEWAAVSNLKRDSSIVILEADKGNATVVMDKEEYENKVQDILGKQPFRKLSRDPTKSYEKRVNDELKRLNKEGHISQQTLSALRLQAGESRPPLFYGKVKLHKEGTPLRPIVSSIGSCTYKIAKRLAPILTQYSQQVQSYIRNTKELVEEVRSWEIKQDEVLISFDIKALYTSVPVEDALKAVNNRLQCDQSLEDWCGYTRETILALLKLCLNCSYFKFRDNHYSMEDGLAMGSPVSPPVANLFMAEFEESALASFEKEKPKKWQRYVDDVISIVKRSLVRELLEHLNSRHKNILFTFEIEKDGCLPMLDLVLHRTENGRINTTVFRKPTHTERYLPFTSHHPSSMKRSVVKSLLHRVEYISPELTDEKEREIKHVMEVMVKNGYPEAWIKSCKVNPRAKDISKETKTSLCIPYIRGLSEQIRRILGNLDIRTAFKPMSWRGKIMEGIKDKEEEGKKAGVVYEITCNTCNKSYIGETGRNAEIRAKEHRAHARNGHPEQSAVAQHALEGHIIDWNPKVIGRAGKTKTRRIKEALLIHKKEKDGKTILNRDKGLELSTMWLDLV